MSALGYLGVVDGLAEYSRTEGGDVEDRAQRHAASVLEPGDALKCHLLRYNVDVWKAPLLLQAPDQLTEALDISKGYGNWLGHGDTSNCKLQRGSSMLSWQEFIPYVAWNFAHCCPQVNMSCIQLIWR